MGRRGEQGGGGGGVPLSPVTTGALRVCVSLCAPGAQPVCPSVPPGPQPLCPRGPACVCGGSGSVSPGPSLCVPLCPRGPACVCGGSGSHQAVAVAEGHLAGVGPVLQVAHVEALGGVGVAPGQAAPPPVLHPELPGQQAPLQRQVEQQGGARCGQLVEELGGQEGAFRVQSSNSLSTKREP